MTDRVTSAALFERTISGINDIQGKLAKLHQQITSTKKAGSFPELGNDITRVLNLESSVSEAERFVRSNKLVINRLDTTDSAISAIQKISIQFKQDLSRENSSSGSVQNLTELAKNALDNIADQLNKQDGDRYIFAGSRTNSPAVGDIKAVTNIIGGTATGNYYLGDDVVFSAKASDSLDVTYGVKANDSAFKNLIGAIHKAIEAETSGTNGDLVNAGELLDNALDELVTLRTKIGADLQSFEEANVQHLKVQDQLKEFLSKATDTDIVQASIEVAQNEATLTAAMQTFVRISRLSLTEFLS